MSRHLSRQSRRTRFLASILLVGFLMVQNASGAAAEAAPIDDVSPTTNKMPSPVSRDSQQGSDKEKVYGTYADVLGAISDGDVLEASFDRYESLVVLTLVDGSLLESRYPSSRAPSLVVSLLEAGVRVGSLPDPMLTTSEIATGEAMAAANKGAMVRPAAATLFSSP